MVTIQKPKNNIVLMDLDMTIIDRKQQLNDDRLKPTITSGQHSGWTFGLNSDTPVSSLRTWSERFGITGPIIAEKGAVLQVGDKLIYAKPEAAEAFSKAFELVVARLENSDIHVVRGSPVEMMFKNEVFGTTAGEKVVFANDLRKASLGLFVYKTDQNSHLVPDKESTGKIAKLINDLLPKSETTQTWVDSDYGLIVASDSDINKRNGSILLMETLRLEEVAMIGDSRLDYIGEDIAKHYAVGNADSDFRGKAVYVSEHDLTAGVVDILTLLRT